MVKSCRQFILRRNFYEKYKRYLQLQNLLFLSAYNKNSPNQLTEAAFVNKPTNFLPKGRFYYFKTLF